MSHRIQITEDSHDHSGDGGETSLIGPERWAKDALRIEVNGELDELHAALTLIVAEQAEQSPRNTSPPADTGAILTQLLSDLTEIMAEIAGVPDRLTANHVRFLDATLAQLEASLPATQCFVVFSTHAGAARLNWCRTLCRRVERRAVALQRTQNGTALQRAEHGVSSTILAYLNRLSDVLFSLARAEDPLRVDL